MRVALIVNDMSEVNIDAALVRDGGANLSRTQEDGKRLIFCFFLYITEFPERQRP